MNKAQVLEELHRLYYVKPYDEDEDILRKDLAEAMGYSESYIPKWVDANADKVEEYDVRMPSGNISKAYRVIA